MPAWREPEWDGPSEHWASLDWITSRPIPPSGNPLLNLPTQDALAFLGIAFHLRPRAVRRSAGRPRGHGAPRPAKPTEDVDRLSVPSDPVLRELWKDVPGYELLVRYLKTFKPELIRDLLSPAQKGSPAQKAAKKAIIDAQQRTLIDAQRRDRVAKLQAHTRDFRERSAGRLSALKKAYESPSSMLLTAAWFLMDRDNQGARENSAVVSFIEERLTPQWGLSIDDALKFSYVPREVIRLSDVYRQTHEVRHPRGLLDQATRRRHERWWWGQLGFKQTDGVNRQSLWRPVFRRLVDALLTADRNAPWRPACRDACRLVHLRYPKVRPNDDPKAPEAWPDDQKAQEAVRNWYRDEYQPSTRAERLSLASALAWTSVPSILR